MKSNLPAEYYIRKLAEMSSENDQLKKRVKLMETKAGPVEQSGRPTFQFEEFTKEIEKWEKRIDSIYDLMKTEQECYFAQCSKQKVLLLRTKLKEATEKAKQEFKLHGSELDRVSKAIDRISITF